MDKEISIHALREEGDFSSFSKQLIVRISIHALREEGDFANGGFTDGSKEFLSTPSARRATCGEQRKCNGQRISIHALREEGDWT